MLSGFLTRSQPSFLPSGPHSLGCGRKRETKKRDIVDFCFLTIGQ